MLVIANKIEVNRLTTPLECQRMTIVTSTHAYTRIRLTR